MITTLIVIIAVMWLVACLVTYSTRNSRPRASAGQPTPVLQSDKDAAKDNYDNYSAYNSALRTWFISFGLGALALFMVHPEFVELLKKSGQFGAVILLFLFGCLLQVVIALFNKFASWQLYDAHGEGESAHPFWEGVSGCFFFDEVVDLSTAAAFALAIGIMVVAFVYSPVQKSTSSTSFQKPTATEVFNLRSQCAELGDKLLDDQRSGIGPALSADAKSRYDLSTNRCYVQIDVSTADLQDPKWKTTQRLYDGQTKENLAWFTTRGPAHPEEDQCAEYLDMPVGRTCREINEKILAVMSDSRND